MSDRKADLNLLTGVKAWQLELITKDQLLEAFQTWTLDKEQTVTEILRNRQLITDADKSYLDRLARGHSQDETADLTQSIRSDADLDQLRSDLTRLSDTDLLESLDATQSADTKEPAIGLRFMRIREHTKGGLGVVWLAKDCELHRDVAIKEIREDHANNPLDRQRFVLEAEITGGLEHPNIVPVYGMGKYADGRPYYAMRFIRGTSLRDAIDEYHHRNPRKLIGGRNSEIELRRLLSRFIDVCHAIAYAHSRLVLHRDLKPDNIMLGKFGETLVVDWGLADPVGQREVPDRGDDKTNTEPELEQPLKPNSGSIPTSPGQPLGTIGFMSPEQARGDIANLGRATDIYSLGATLYQMLTGAAPVRSRNLGEALEKIAAGKFPKPCELKPDVPKALEAICLKAMALSPDQRYATAHLLAEDIENWMADDPVSAFPDTRWQCAQRWLRKNRTWAQAGAISLLVITIAMSISAVLINRYRQTQLAASRMSELNAIFDKEILQPEFFQPNSLGNLKELLDQLEHLGATNTNDKYENLVSLFSRHLSELRSDQKFNAQRKADYDQQISQFQDLFGQRAQSVCEKWLTEGQSRYADWYTVFDAPEQDSFASLALAPNQFTVLAANKLGRTATEINPANETSIAPVNAADFRWSVSFDHTWCNSSIVGLNVMYEVSKSSTKASEYSFIIASLDANSSVIENREFNKLSPISAELIDQFSMEVQMIILRNGSQLRRKRIRLARTPIQMQCIRQANTLEFSISSTEENYSHFLKIEDPFALPQKPGTVGVFWPSNVVVQSMKLEQMSNPTQLNPMEEADEHYNQSRFLEALTLYEKMPASPEVNYKKALAFAATNRQAEHDTIINELVSDLADASDADRRWSNLAGLRYLASLAAKKDMSLMREVLQNWRITDEQLASIPQTEREVIFQEFGKVGLRFRIVFKTEDDIKSLETRTSIINHFSEDEVARRNTLWRLADCYRIAGRIADAKQILEDLANNQWRDGFDIKPFQLALTRRDKRVLQSDLLWLVGAEDEGNDPQAALKLFKPESQSDPLVIEQARLNLMLYKQAVAEGAEPQSLEHLKLARRLLDAWLEKPPADTTYMDAGQAHLLRGLIAQYERGDAPNGTKTAIDVSEYWKRALRRSWRGGALRKSNFEDLLGAEGVLATNELAIDGAAISLFKEISVDEIENALTCYIPGSGISNSIGTNVVKRLVSPKGGKFGQFTAQDLLKRVFTDLYDTPQGARLRERMILRSCSLKEFQHDPIYHILYRVIYLAGFQDSGFPPDVEPVIWEELKALVWLYDKPASPKVTSSKSSLQSSSEQRLEDKDFEKILALFNGNYNKKAWESLQSKFGNRLSGSAAYVFGNIYRLLGQTDRAKEFLQFAITSPDTLPVIVAACQADLKKIEEEP